MRPSADRSSVLVFERSGLEPDGDRRELLVLDISGDLAAVALVTTTDTWYLAHSAEVLPFVLTLDLLA